jgi:hypothetical protein
VKKNGNKLGKRSEQDLMGIPPLKGPLPILPGLSKQTVQKVTQIEQIRSGPLPDPDSLAAYDKIQPGFCRTHRFYGRTAGISSKGY